MSDSGYPGWQNSFAANNQMNAISFLIRQMMADATHVALVLVKSVTQNQTAGAPPLVNVQPMVAQVDQIGTAVPHGIIYNVPTFRFQSGQWAFVLDPQAGDIGAVICADRDISSVIANQAPANPGSFRRFDWSDALYIGGFASVNPTQYVKIDSNGVTVQAAAGSSVKINADTMHLAGASGSSNTSISVTGSITATGDVIGGGKDLTAHVHSGVQSGSSNTGPPV